MIIHKASGNSKVIGYVMGCPGCNGVHVMWTDHPSREKDCNFNGNLEAPTFSPSLSFKSDYSLCTFFIRNGFINFLKTSTHAMANNKVQLKQYSIHEILEET